MSYYRKEKYRSNLWTSIQDIQTRGVDDLRFVMYSRRNHNLYSPLLARTLPTIMQENEVYFNEIDKIFASAWLNAHEVVAGTKCNKLIVYNVDTCEIRNIPLLYSRKSVAPSVPLKCYYSRDSGNDVNNSMFDWLYNSDVHQVYNCLSNSSREEQCILGCELDVKTQLLNDCESKGSSDYNQNERKQRSSTGCEHCIHSRVSALTLGAHTRGETSKKYGELLGACEKNTIISAHGNGESGVDDCVGNGVDIRRSTLRCDECESSECMCGSGSDVSDVDDVQSPSLKFRRKMNNHPGEIRRRRERSRESIRTVTKIASMMCDRSRCEGGNDNHTGTDQNERICTHVGEAIHCRSTRKCSTIPTPCRRPYTSASESSSLSSLDTHRPYMHSVPSNRLSSQSGGHVHNTYHRNHSSGARSIVQPGFLNTATDTFPLTTHCGIHSIAINPSRTLLATGGVDVNNIGVYLLPSFQPVCICLGHDDWVFCLKWISDGVLVSGSRDASVCTWNIMPFLMEQSDSKSMHAGTCIHIKRGDRDRDKHDLDDNVVDNGSYSNDGNVNLRREVRTNVERQDANEALSAPVCRPMRCAEQHIGKVRDMALDGFSDEIATLSSDVTVKIWDQKRLVLKSAVKLKHQDELACMTTTIHTHECGYAVGSQHHISFLDPRLGSVVCDIASLDEGMGVRSLSMRGSVISIGGGLGRLSFYDMRAQCYIDVNNHRTQNEDDLNTNGTLNCTNNKKSNPYLYIGSGWLMRNGIWETHFMGSEVRNAVYTHSYDETGARIFVAGGPPQLGLVGSYAGVWQ
eukprot:CFRG6335T1